MRKVKKLLVTLLVLTFVISTMSVGFAAESTKETAAVTRAQALGILKGDDQGNLNLNKPITRAEALALIIRISGLEGSAELMKGQTAFADANADPGLQWATGYINLGVGQEIINGYPDKTFKGRNTVTYAEMAKMLLYAMNYGVTVEGAPWPAGVMGKADDLDLFDGVNALPNVPAVRGDVVEMIDNALTVKHLVQTGYGDLKQYVEGDKTFLSKLEVEELKDVRVTDIARVNNKLDDDEVELTEYDKDGDVKDSEIYTIKADVNAEEIFGLEVDAWVNDDDEIFFVKAKTAEKDILFDTASKVEGKNKIELKEQDKEYKLADGAKLYVNFEEVELAELPDNVYGKVVLDRGEIKFANFFEFEAGDLGVVTKVDKDEVEFVNAEGKEDDLYLGDAEEVYVYNADFSKADVEDIKKDSAIFFWENKDDEIFIIVKNEVVEGKADRVRTDKIRVDGKEYKKGDYAIITLDKGDNYERWNADKVEDFIDEDVKIVLDLRGRVLLVSGDAKVTSADMYGIVTYAEDGRYVTLSIFNEEGEEVEYKAEGRTDFAKLIEAKLKFDKTEYAVIKFKLNSDGEIAEEDCKIKVVGKDVARYNEGYEGQVSKDADAEVFKLDSGKKFYITKDTVVMKAVDGTDLDPEIIKTDKFISNSVKKEEASSAIVFGEAGKDADFIVFTNAGFQGTDKDTLYGVVTDGYWKEGKNYYSEINVFDESTKEYKLKENDIAKFKNGAVVAFDINNNDEAVFNGTIKTGEPLEYKDGYLKVIGADAGTYKVDSAAVIYNLDDGEVDKKISASRLADYATIKFVVDEDGIIVAATVATKLDADDIAARANQVAVDEAIAKVDAAYELAAGTEDTDEAKIDAVKSAVKAAIADDTITVTVEKEADPATTFKVTLTKGGKTAVKTGITVTIA